jgi:hypothetical protein
MPDYWLPCTCGQKTAVSTAQAGETIRCPCGAELQVPTLRGLRVLEPAEAASGAARRARGRTWEDRHRAAFVLVIGSLVCLGLAAYLWIAMPARLIVPNPQEIATAIDGASPDQVLQVYAEMQQGLGSPAGAEPHDKSRRVMLWGGALAAAVATAQIGAAVFVLRRKERRK